MEPRFDDETCGELELLGTDPVNCDAWISHAVMCLRPGRGFRVPAEFAGSLQVYVDRGRECGADLVVREDVDGTRRVFCCGWSTLFDQAAAVDIDEGDLEALASKTRGDGSGAH